MGSTVHPPAPGKAMVMAMASAMVSSRWNRPVTLKLFNTGCIC